MMAMGSVEAAVHHSVTLLVAAAVGVLVGSVVLRGVEAVLGQRLSKERARFNPAAAVLGACLRPAQVRCAAGNPPRSWLQGILPLRTAAAL
jgi:hypothetical protein